MYLQTPPASSLFDFGLLFNLGHYRLAISSSTLLAYCTFASRQVNGDHHYDARKGLLLWTIDRIDKTNSSGATDFVASPTASPDSFFPVEVRMLLPATTSIAFQACDLGT